MNKMIYEPEIDKTYELEGSKLYEILTKIKQNQGTFNLERNYISIRGKFGEIGSEIGRLIIEDKTSRFCLQTYKSPDNHLPDPNLIKLVREYII